MHRLPEVVKMRLKIAMFMFFALICFSYATAQAEDQPAPKIVAAQRQHDFGTVYQGTELKWEFEILNQGNAPLIIEKVPAS